MAETPVSAIVVCRNEAANLPRCLRSLAFCAETIVVDLESSDGSPEVARRLGATVLERDRVPLVERVRPAAVEKALNDWVLLIDPDEEVSPGLAADIADVVAHEDPARRRAAPAHAQLLPGPGAEGNLLGGPRQDEDGAREPARGRPAEPRALAITLHPGCRAEYMTPRGDNWLNHFWVESWKGFLEKHRRYIGLEGEARYARGERFTWARTLARFPVHFYRSLIVRRGYRDGLVGVFLSLVWALYNLGAGLSLRAYQKRLRQPASGGPPPPAGGARSGVS